MKRYINLLPPSEQNQLAAERTGARILNFGIFLVLSLVVLSLFLFAGLIILKNRATGIALDLSQGKQELTQLAEQAIGHEVEDINRDIKNFKTLNLQSENYSAAFMELARILPPDLTLDSMAVTRADKKMEISGRGASRVSVLKLRREILASEYFRNVNFPLANLEKATDVKWSYRFFINPEKLK